MRRTKKIVDWVATIDGKSTFAGIIIDCFDEMCEDNYWRAESTKKHYLADYERRILPYIEDHDSLTIDNYTYTHYQDILSEIKKSEKYTEERILHLMRLISAVARMAAKKYGYPDVLWGTAFELPEEIDEKEKIQELVILKKSFSPKQEIELFLKLSDNVQMSGERFGTYLMFAFGVRNGEAAAILFGDILESYIEDGFHVVIVYKTIESKEHRLVSSGKTKNADRIIPIPEPAYNFLMRRKQFVAEQEGKSIHDIDKYPVACVGKDYKRHCTPDQIAQSSKVVFEEIGLKPRVLSFLDYEILRGENPIVVREKDPTSYLMRRNFATQMVILGMTEAEIQFLLGHDITDAYETRNEMVNFSALKKMGEKMKLRAVFKKQRLQVDLSMDYQREYTFRDHTNLFVKVSLDPEDLLIISTVSEEPEITPRVQIKSDARYQEERVNYVMPAKYKADRTINVLNKYHDVYSKYSKR